MQADEVDDYDIDYILIQYLVTKQLNRVCKYSQKISDSSPHREYLERKTNAFCKKMSDVKKHGSNQFARKFH